MVVGSTVGECAQAQFDGVVPHFTCSEKYISMKYKILLILSAFAFLSACSEDTSNPPADNDTAQDTLPETSPDTSPPPPETFQRNAPLNVFFTYRDSEQAGQGLPLYRVDTSTDDNNLTADQLTSSSSNLDCSLGRCWVTEDGRFLVLFETNGGRINVIPRDSNGIFNASASTNIATGASQIELIGNRVGFVASNNAQYLDLSLANVGTPINFGPVAQTTPDGITYTGGGIALSPLSQHLLLYRTNPGSLATFRIDLASGQENVLFRLGIPNVNTPSPFSNINPVVFAADNASAVALIEGPMLYNLCTQQSDCADLSPDAQCLFARDRNGDISTNGLCALSQKALFSFQINSSDLGQPCTSDSECSPQHRCTTDPSTLFADAPPSICTPRALILGPSISPNQPCDDLKEGDLAIISPKLRLNHLNQILLLSRLDRSCTSLNIHDDSLYAIDFDLDPSTLQVIEGHYGHDAGAGFCYDQQEETWNYPDCAIEIDDFDVGPDGRGLILKGSAPGSDNSGRELWAFDSKDRKYPITNDVLSDVIHMSTASVP